MGTYLDSDKLKNYLEGKSGPCCKEERQFAVFLYIILLDMKKEGVFLKKDVVKERMCIENKENGETKDKESKDVKIKIIDVYFEAALMRDYWNKEKSHFNDQLLKFCLRWLGNDEYYGKKLDELLEELKDELNDEFLGQGKAKNIINKKYSDITNVTEIIKNEKEDGEKYNDIKEKACLDIARMMMNAIPDILVIYEEERTEGIEVMKTMKAKALECKYESDEGTYKDVAGAEYKMQLFIQECIMCFLFGKGESDRWKRHIPHFPERSKVWRGKKDKWGKICREVYEGILKQDRGTEESGSIINAGVELIRFKEKKQEGDYILILIKELTEKVYNKNKSIS